MKMGNIALHIICVLYIYIYIYIYIYTNAYIICTKPYRNFSLILIKHAALIYLNVVIDQSESSVPKRKKSIILISPLEFH